MPKAKDTILTKENCRTDAPTNVQLNPEVRWSLARISAQTGDAMYLVVNIAVKHLENSMTPDVMKRVEAGESLARIFDVRG